MMEEFYPKAIHRSGPFWKQGYPDLSRYTRTGKGAICHSMEGTLAAAFARLDGPNMASWTGSVAKDGTVYQHYPLSACCWHAGHEERNILWAGWEFEGRMGEPLTPEQVDAAIGLLTWQAIQEGWDQVAPHVTLGEHNWYYPTACPSGRIPWDRIIGGINMALVSKAEFDAYKNMVGLQQFSRDLRDGLITDLLGGKYRVGLKPNLTRVLILPSGVEVPID